MIHRLYSVLLAVLFATTVLVPCARAGQGWFLDLQDHARYRAIHGEEAPFLFESVSRQAAPGFSVTGERIHLENGILTAHFDTVSTDVGSEISDVNAKTFLSLGGGFLDNPVRSAVEAFLDHSDLTAKKVDVVMNLNDDEPQSDPDLAAIPVRNLKIAMRQRNMDMSVKSLIPVSAEGISWYEEDTQKLVTEITGAKAGPIPIPRDLLFFFLKKFVNYDYVEIDKPHVIIDLGYFLGTSDNGALAAD